MFEHIHFAIVTQREITFPDGTMMLAQDAANPDSASNLPEGANRLMSTINPYGCSDYSLDGIIRTPPWFPVSDLIMEQFCWLQSFGWADSGRGYYTSRWNASTYMLLYTYSGEGTLEYEGVRYRLTPGTGFFIDCRKYQDYRTAGGRWEHLDLHMDGPMIAPVYEEFARGGSPLFYEPVNGELQEHAEQLARVCDSGMPCRDFQVAGILYNMAVHVLALSVSSAHREDSVTENLEYLIRYIDKHYTEKLTLDFLARFSGISKYYLSREFHRYTGFPPNEYIIRHRIAQAQMLLAETSDPVGMVAEQVGIPNVQHFSKQFRRITGVSPREYRSQIRRRFEAY